MKEHGIWARYGSGSHHFHPHSTGGGTATLLKEANKYELVFSPEKGAVHFDVQLAVSDTPFTLNK